MADFDSLWNDDMGIDLDSLNANIAVNKKVNKTVTDEKPVVSNNTEEDEEWENLDKASQWRKTIADIERNVLLKYTNAKDRWEYKKDNILNKFRKVKGTNTPEERSLADQLRDLKLDYLELKQQSADDTTEVDFLKGRAAGFINKDNYFDYNDNPAAVKAELATGNYEYTPTKDVFA